MRPTTLRAFAVLFTGAFAGAGAQQAPLDVARYPSVLTYRTEKVADGVYAFITPEERSGFQSGNSIAVIGEDGVLVFDTGSIPSSTRRQIAEIRKLTDKPVRFVVNSHWHFDHNLGNNEYKKAFPGVVIVGTTATRTGIRDRAAGNFEYLKGFRTADSLLRGRLATGLGRDGKPISAKQRVSWGLFVRDYADFFPDVLTAVPLAPDLVFDDSLTISLGARQVKLFNAGRGNTDGDAFAVVPDARVLLTGDLVTVPCPFPSTAYFSDWIAALDRLGTLNAANIVFGHGEVQHDYQYAKLTRELLVFTRDKAAEAVRKGISLDSLQRSIDFTPFVKRFSGGDLVREAAFDN
ncbi:MAG TPA: MBL fold metallo-hydrolase, partial [Gemmatimonadaceae bacterium]|nr:MBL fold metallo-hydrolase [Gemmatimonadaceae bacterium]